jgi:hypothetical protein
MTKSRKQCQSGDVCEPSTLTEAIYCTLHHSGVDVVEVAKQMRVRPGYLQDASNSDRDEVQFQARMLPQLMTVTSNVKPLQWLCREMDGVFVAFPEVSAAHDDVYRGMCDAIEEVGQSSSAVKRALANNDVTEEEADSADKEIDEAVAALLRVKAAVRSKVPRPRPQIVGGVR